MKMHGYAIKLHTYKIHLFTRLKYAFLCVTQLGIPVYAKKALIT